jgi:hypothetical protein
VCVVVSVYTTSFAFMSYTETVQSSEAEATIPFALTATAPTRSVCADDLQRSKGGDMEKGGGGGGGGGGSEDCTNEGCLPVCSGPTKAQIQRRAIPTPASKLHTVGTQTGTRAQAHAYPYQSPYRMVASFNDLMSYAAISPVMWPRMSWFGALSPLHAAEVA